MRKGRLVLAFVVASSLPAMAAAQDPDSAFDFWLSKNYVRSLAENRGLFYSIRLNMNATTDKVHDLAGDCELHIAATPPDAQQRFWPKGIVVEPPNLCKTWPPGTADDGDESNLRNHLWPDFLDANVMGRECEVVGGQLMRDSPRFSGTTLADHARGGLTDGTESSSCRVMKLENRQDGGIRSLRSVYPGGHLNRHDPFRPSHGQGRGVSVNL